MFRGTSTYQYGQGVGDVPLGKVRYIPSLTQFLKFVANKGIQTLIKAGSKAIKEGATVTGIIKSTLKPTICAVLGATVDQVASKLIEMRNNQNDSPPTNPLIMLPELNQALSDKKRRSQTVYKKKSKHSTYLSNQRPLIYNF